jgi:nitrile hydratase
VTPARRSIFANRRAAFRIARPSGHRAIGKAIRRFRKIGQRPRENIRAASLAASRANRDRPTQKEPFDARGTHARIIPLPGIVSATGEKPVFRPGDRIRVLTRTPIGHYRVPTYLRGKTGLVESVIEPAAVDNEQEGYGRNAGAKLHYYRIAIPMTEIWHDYVGSPRDGLHIEVYETWLERI